jgi:hypothetical protein
MAQPRSVRTERDNARARALGYESYYDWRAHDSGRIPPGEPRAQGERLAALRGHRGAADLERLLKSGRVELVNTVTTVDAKGRVGVDVLVTKDDGSTVEFRVSQPKAGQIGGVLDDMGSDAPPLVGSPRSLTSFGGASSEVPDVDERDDYDEGLER